MSQKKTLKKPINEKKDWKRIEDENITKPFLVSLNSLCFTDDDIDLISNDFCLEKQQQKKKQPRKKKVTELEKPKEDEVYDLTNDQKQIVQKNSIIRERLLAVDKILEMYPNLKKDKIKMVDCVLGKQEVQKKDYVLEKLDIKTNKSENKNRSIYKDSYGNLIDSEVNLVGFWTEETGPDKKLQNTFTFFDDIKKIKTKMIRNKKKINMAYVSNIKKNNKVIKTK